MTVPETNLDETADKQAVEMELQPNASISLDQGSGSVISLYQEGQGSAQAIESPSEQLTSVRANEAQKDFPSALVEKKELDPTHDTECSSQSNNNSDEEAGKQQATLPTTGMTKAPGRDTSKSLPRWYPKWRGNPVFDGNPEALAWCLSAMGQSIIFICMGAFVAPALLILATQAAGCATEPLNEEDDTIPECNETIYGIKPSSLLTLLTSVVGLGTAFLIPFVGAIVDYTPHRRLIGRWASVLYSLFILALAFLSQDSWFPLTFFVLLAAFVGWSQSMLLHAYLPTLTDDEQTLNNYSKAFTMWPFSVMVFYLIFVMGLSVALGFANDGVAVARLGSAVASVLTAILFFIAWGLLFEKRPVAHQLAENESLGTAGFRQVYRSTIKICKHYKALKWFYVSIVFGDAAIQSLGTISVTFLSDMLQFSAQEVGIAALLMLFASIPGAAVGAFVNRKINPVRSSILAVACMIVGTTLASILLVGPKQQILTYFFALAWGGGTGWKYTSDRVLAASILPGGQDAELMGFYMFCGQVFAWVPSLVFTLLNEFGISQRIGLASLNAVFLGALLCYLKMGSYRDALALADRLRLETVLTSQTVVAQ